MYTGGVGNSKIHLVLKYIYSSHIKHMCSSTLIILATRHSVQRFFTANFRIILGW